MTLLRFVRKIYITRRNFSQQLGSDLAIKKRHTCALEQQRFLMIRSNPGLSPDPEEEK